jgi:dienelactone hydrolase
VILSSAFANTTSRAEGTATPEPGQKVKIKASDDLEIVGLFYPAASKAPAVLLLHDGVATKEQWLPFVPAFTEAGYNVLIVDQRAAGETGMGSTVGNAAELKDKDVPAMVAWLRQQPSVDPDAVALIGARLGANFAIRACAADEQCHAVVALTPSTDFFGIKTVDAVKSIKKGKALFLVGSQFGEKSVQSIKELESAAADEVNIMSRRYGMGFKYGVDMLEDDPSLMPMILLWLKTYNHS